MTDLREYINAYSNTAKNNDEIHQGFTQKTNEISFLKKHRDHIENNKLGFGDRAFHFMWYLLFKEVGREKGKVDVLEIGVYKGQVISLIALLSKELQIPAAISAISPLEGTVSANSLFNNRIVNKIRRTFSAAYRKQEKEGNVYRKENYEVIIEKLFSSFGLNFSSINLYKGYSNDTLILDSLKNKDFDLIYIDGDHSYEGVKKDILNFTPNLRKGGFLVMDDASWFLPGNVFWKGHEEVSKACSIIEGLGFKNVLNVGHNRIYQKL